MVTDKFGGDGVGMAKSWSESRRNGPREGDLEDPKR
jgi:hypothetical protein